MTLVVLNQNSCTFDYSKKSFYFVFIVARATLFAFHLVVLL